MTFCFHEKNWPIQFVDRKKSLFCLVVARCFFREAGGFTEQILDVPADPVISLRIADHILGSICAFDDGFLKGEMSQLAMMGMGKFHSCLLSNKRSLHSDQLPLILKGPLFC